MLGPAPGLPPATVLLRVVVLLLAAAALPRRRGLAVALAAAAAGVGAWAVALLLRAPAGWLLDEPGTWFAVGRLQVALTLVMDGAAVVLLAGVLGGALWAALGGAPRALRGALAALGLLILADNMLVMLGAWDGLVLCGLWAALSAGQGRARLALGVDRAGAVALLLALLLLFFGVGGSWSQAGRGYLVDALGGEFPAVEAWLPAPRPLLGKTPEKALSGTVQMLMGPVTSLRYAATQQALREADGSRPVASLLANKLLLGARLRSVLLALLTAALLLRGLAPLALGTRRTAGLWPARGALLALSLGAALSLGLRLRVLWSAGGLVALWVVPALLLGGCHPAGPRLQAEGLVLPANGGSGVVTLRNAGTAPLQIELVTLSGDSAGFSVTSPPAQALLPGGTLPLNVSFQPDGKRRQAYGAVQVRCDDPAGRDEARTPERESIIGVPLSAGAPSWLAQVLLWLPLPPLLAVGLLGVARRRRAAPSRDSSSTERALALAGALAPLLFLLPVAWTFQSATGVAEGNYGFQFLLHRTISQKLGIELHLGIDGVSLVLLPLAVLLPAAALTGAASSAPRWLLLESCLLLGLCALDLPLLGLAWLGSVVLLAPPRSGWSAARWCALAGVVIAAVAAVLLVRVSLPTQLVDGTPAPHALDVVKLTYQNYFGRDALPGLPGLPLGKAVWLLLVTGLLLPLLPLYARRGPPDPALGLAPLLPVYLILRLADGALPEGAQAAAAGLALLGAALLCWGAVAAWRPAGGSGDLDDARPVALQQVGLCLLGMASFAGSGTAGALLILLGQGLWLGLRQAAPATAGWRQVSLAAALGCPGSPLFPGQVLVLWGSFPDHRLATVLAALALAARWLGPWAAGALSQGPTGPLRGRVAVLLLPALVLAIYPAPLLHAMSVSVADFITHTAGLRGAATLVQAAAAGPAEGRRGAKEPAMIGCVWPCAPSPAYPSCCSCCWPR